MLWPYTKATDESLGPRYVLSVLAQENFFVTWHYLLPFNKLDISC